MKIKLKKHIDASWEDYELQSKDTVEEIYKKIKNELPYPIIVAKVNNKIENLRYELSGGEKVELLDIRVQSANLIYQNSIVKLFLMAVKETIGDVRVEVQNSLNKGLYTQIIKKPSIEEEDVKQIENKMQELKSQCINFDPSVCDHVSDGDRLLVPTTDYVYMFELRKYKGGLLIRFPYSSSPDEMPEYEDQPKLYDTFAEQTMWGELLGVEHVEDLNKKIAKGKSKELIQLSEALHEKRISQIADRIIKENKRIILLAGPSSSGKTTSSHRLILHLKILGAKPLYLGTDDYFLERTQTPVDENGEKNFENLSAIDVDLFNKHMNSLLAGEEVDLPRFNFITGCKEYGHRITKVGSKQPIIIEGIHALNDDMTPQIDENEKFKIYISPLTQLNIDPVNRIPTTEARMYRRMVRDYKYRGKSARQTIAEWPKVRAGEDINIFPYNGKADVFLNSTHIYELAVLKKYAKPLLEEITQDEEEYADAERLLRFLEPFDIIEDDSVIVNHSILREFIGGSVFSE